MEALLDPLCRSTHDQPTTAFTLEMEPDRPKPPPKNAPRPERRRAEKKADKSWKVPYIVQPAVEQEIWFRHTHWAAKRRLVLAALKASGTSSTSLESFYNCGADCVVEIDAETKQYRLRATYCHNRHCEPCQRAKANMLAANLRAKLEDGKEHQYRFITLTLKHNTEPLADQIHRLYASFKKLRNTKFWKESQIGGAVVLEVKWKPETRHWHPHLHIIAEGSFIRKQDLSKYWGLITGDSFIVDIRSLDSGKDAAHYVAKYVSKGTNNEVWHDADAAQEWITAMKGVRTAATYGTWRGFKLLQHKKDEADWRPVGLLRIIVDNARAGDQVYIRLLDALINAKQYDPHKKRPPKVDSKP
jgi:hypothetical protein